MDLVTFTTWKRKEGSVQYGHSILPPFNGSLPHSLLPPPLHPASRVTLWVSHGKFASRTSFQGGLFFFFRGAIFFLQGGLFFWHEKWKFTFRGALAPLKENCILSSKLVIWTYCQTFLHYYAAKVGLDPQICISFCQIWQYIYKGSKHIHIFDTAGQGHLLPATRCHCQNW